MKQIFHARKQRQLRHLVKRLKTISKDCQHQMDPLVRKIKGLAKELSYVLAPYHLKKILGPAALILGISFGSQVSAQSFAAPQQNPFGLTSSYGYSFPAFADLDNDGDLDLMVGQANEYEGVLRYFKNTGTTSNPQFAAAVENPFGITLDSVYVFPAFADLDNDGDMDLLVGESYGNMRYFKNTGTAANPQFPASVLNPFGLVSQDYFATPTFVDLDNDGDMDLLVGEYQGNMQYFKNIGSVTNPQFAPPQQNPFGITSAESVGFSTFADLDGDGDLDLLIGEYYGNMRYFKNTGSAANPQFAPSVENPFGLVETYDLAAPAFADLDNDGDMDLLVGEYEGAMQYFKNTSPVSTHEQNANFPLELHPNPVADLLSIRTDVRIERMEAYDAMGSLFRSYEGALTSINVSDWSSGTYLLKFMDAEGQFVTRKLIKN